MIDKFYLSKYAETGSLSDLNPCRKNVSQQKLKIIYDSGSESTTSHSPKTLPYLTRPKPSCS